MGVGDDCGEVGQLLVPNKYHAHIFYCIAAHHNLLMPTLMTGARLVDKLSTAWWGRTGSLESP